MKLTDCCLVVAVVTFQLSIVYGLSEQDGNEYSNSTKILTRQKRYLIFRDISRGFVRANVKDRAIDSTNIWAQAYGFRWNVEFNNPPGLRITKRSLHSTIGEIIQSRFFKGREYILGTFCELLGSMSPSKGILFKLFKRIFTHSSSAGASFTSSNNLTEDDDLNFPFMKLTDCLELDQHFPVSRLDLSSGGGSDVR